MRGEYYNHALLLFRSDRPSDAIEELQKGIADDEGDPYSHGLLALCLSRLDKHQHALEAARQSIAAAPDCEYGHYALARVYTERNRFTEARAAVKQAIQIDPEDAHSQGLLARIEYGAGNWRAAVDAADAGLAHDADNDVCLHYRSLALLSMGRAEEALRDQDALLAADPNDSYTHTARGWTLLEQGDVDNAKWHFLESLRLDPTNEDARAGLVHTLKSQHRIFGLTLRLLCYIDRFRTSSIWIAAFGFFFGLRQLDRLAHKHPDALVWLVLLKSVVFAVMILLLVAHPLSGLVLRLDRDGRRALTPDKIRASNWHALCLLGALALGLLWAWKSGREIRTLAMAILMLTFAVTQIFDTTPGWARRRMTWITLFAAALIPASYFATISALLITLKYKLNVFWLLMLGMVYMPSASVLISAFSADIAGWLERRRPDSEEYSA